MVHTARKIYTPRASLCALGCYLMQQHMLDDVLTLPVPQKKGVLYTGRKTHRDPGAHSRRRDRDEPT
jgi:hypothetical protein